MAVESIKLGADVRKDWLAINGLGTDLAALRTQLGLEAGTGARGPDAPSRWHPFRIYQFPWRLRAHTHTNLWRYCLVRSGLIVTPGSLIAPAGTDGVSRPYSGELSDESAEFVCDADCEKFWVYLVISGGGASVETSAVEPEWGSSTIPIGWVDTLTRASEKVAVVRQILTGDVILLGGGGTGNMEFRDTWTVGDSYSKGNVVVYEGDVYMFTADGTVAGTTPDTTANAKKLTGGMRWCGEWSGVAYAVGDVVIWSTSGPAMGAYVATAAHAASGTDYPWNGVGWAKLPNGMGPWL